MKIKMCFIVKLIILLEIYASIHQCKAYVVQSPQSEYVKSENNNYLLENSLNEMVAARDYNSHIDNRVRPNEIREPKSVQDIVNYIGMDKFNKPDGMVPQSQENQHTLNYGELTKLLAFWQWAKEQNFYEMQTDQPATNDNFVTID